MEPTKPSQHNRYERKNKDENAACCGINCKPPYHRELRCNKFSNFRSYTDDDNTDVFALYH